MSPPGNLYASTLVRIRPDDPPAPTLALVAAVALYETLHGALGPSAARLQIKWPNDLLSDGAKLAGILLERGGDAVIIGFGVNLAHYPEGLERPVTSIAALAGTAPPPDWVVEALAARFAGWLARWRREGLDPVRAAWLAVAHPLGTLLSTVQGEGRFAGLDAGGALQLQRMDGSLQLVHAGDVFLV